MTDQDLIEKIAHMASVGYVTPLEDDLIDGIINMVREHDKRKLIDYALSKSATGSDRRRLIQEISNMYEQKVGQVYER